MTGSHISFDLRINTGGGALILSKSVASNWVELNTKYSKLWPNITKRRAADVPKDQEKWRGVKDKLKYFSEKPGKGD